MHPYYCCFPLPSAAASRKLVRWLYRSPYVIDVESSSRVQRVPNGRVEGAIETPSGAVRDHRMHVIKRTGAGVSSFVRFGVPDYSR